MDSPRFGNRMMNGCGMAKEINEAIQPCRHIPGYYVIFTGDFPNESFLLLINRSSVVAGEGMLMAKKARAPTFWQEQKSAQMWQLINLYLQPQLVS